MFLRPLRFFQGALLHEVRKRPNGWDSSLPRFHFNQSSSAFCICLIYIDVLCKMSLEKNPFVDREGAGREGERVLKPIR